jgi:UDP:flavonoid glycosyltransferase YjiC (YdhE family)
MRVLMCTYPGPSHYFPMVPLGWALRAAGHEVVVATQPSFAADVTRSGLSAIAVGPDEDAGEMFRAGFEALLEHVAELPAVWPDTAEALRESGLLFGALMGVKHFAEVATLMGPDLIDFGKSWRPALVVYPPTGFAGAVAAQALGVPAVRHLWGPDFFHFLDEIEAEPLVPLAERFGLDRVNVTGDVVIDPAPPKVQCASAAGTATRHLVRCVPYNGTAVVPAWLAAPPERRRVLVTWGTWIRDMRLRHLFRVPDVLEALAATDVEVVLTATGAERDLLPAVPANVRVVDPVPLHLVLPGCTAIVHQGGTGTTMTAMAYGVPQLVLPQVPDQIFNAGRMTAGGGGRYLPVRDTNAESIAEAIGGLLADEGGRQAAAALREEIAGQPPVPQVVTELEHLAAAPMPG